MLNLRFDEHLRKGPLSFFVFLKLGGQYEHGTVSLVYPAMTVNKPIMFVRHQRLMILAFYNNPLTKLDNKP